MENVVFYKPDEEHLVDTIFKMVTPENPPVGAITIRLGSNAMELLVENIGEVFYEYKTDILKEFDFKGTKFILILDYQFGIDSDRESPLGGMSLDYAVKLDSGITSIFWLPLEMKDEDDEDFTDEDKVWLTKYKLI